MDRVTFEQELPSLQSEFETAHPQAILEWAIDNYGDKLAVVTSFQPTGIITLHMLAELNASPPVITLDTELLFPETYRLIDEVEAYFNLTVNRLKPQLTLPEQAREYGSLLWETNPDQCCHLRKTQPLREELTKYDAWVAGLRRDQSPTRSHTPIIGWDSRNEMVKLSPFATWTEEMVWTYINAHELPYNPLHDRDYPSIGCYTCTMAAQADSSRSGRWSKSTKTECGLHIALFDDQKAG